MPFDLQSFFDYNKEWAKPGPYITKLSDKEEKDYLKWMDLVSQTLRPMDPNDPTYDMRGFWKAAQKGKASSGLDPYSNEIHFPDTFKTPYHPTFSRESQYATDIAPYWDGPTLYENSGAVAYGFLSTAR